MGLGSWPNSTCLDLGFRMLTENNHINNNNNINNNNSSNNSSKRAADGEEGEGDPPRKKYPRISSPPSPSFPQASDSEASKTGGGGRGGRGGGEDECGLSGINQDRSGELSPVSKIHVEGVLPEEQHDHQTSLMNLATSRKCLEEGSNLHQKQEPADDLGNCDGKDDFLLLSSSSFPSSLIDVSGSALSGCVRKQREFTPANRKDQTYWEKRRKNNEAARKSREKRRLHDLMMENRIVDLEEDNSRLRGELHSLKKRYGIPLDVVFMDPAQKKRDSLPDDPGPVSYCGRVARAEDEGVPSVMTLTRDPPPVFTLTTTRMLPTVPGILQTEASPLPAFFMSALPAKPPPQAHVDSTPPFMTHPATLIPYAHQHDSVVVVKTECREDEVDPRSSLHTREQCSGEVYSQYLHSSSQGTLTPAAHCGWSEPLPGGQGLAAHSWRGRISPGSSSRGSGSEDTLDEPLQLTVHRRGSKTESLEEDCSSNESMHCHTNGRLSPHSSLPLKLRHKIPIDASWPHQTTSVGLNGTCGTFSINGLMPGGGGVMLSPTEPSTFNGATHPPELHQDSPLPLIKKEPQTTLEEPHPSLNGHTATKNHTDPKYHDPRYLEDTGLEAPHPSLNGHTMKNHTDPKYHDPKYLERRRRNNEAARKCRANRRNLSKLHEAKSDYLESENSQLRQELDVLQEEMKQLRELLEQKKKNPHAGPQGTKTTQDELDMAQQQTQRLRQLEEEHRLLKLQQQGGGGRGKRQKRRNGKREEMNNVLLKNSLEDTSSDMN